MRGIVSKTKWRRALPSSIARKIDTLGIMFALGTSLLGVATGNGGLDQITSEERLQMIETLQQMQGTIKCLYIASVEKTTPTCVNTLKLALGESFPYANVAARTTASFKDDAFRKAEEQFFKFAVPFGLILSLLAKVFDGSLRPPRSHIRVSEDQSRTEEGRERLKP